MAEPHHEPTTSCRLSNVEAIKPYHFQNGYWKRSKIYVVYSFHSDHTT